MTIRTTIRLPDDLLTLAKQKAAAEGRTLTALIEEGLRLVTEKPRKISIPVSTATGGYRPGFETKTFAELEEIDDLDYVVRMQRGFR